MSFSRERAVQYSGKISTATNLRQFIVAFDSLCFYYSANNLGYLAK